ncbi:putative microfibrillar-associated protein MfaP1 [Penicillium brasilianum]|uniref:Putative microfibrillar-associated protein MfaP1 n=1 Tax=Penicillium brasilianum TaxID=104259 RepID=A0A1S9RV92_PENBI|nr:putative microfibrillar-associated protein MfaP1 [Penicillium brasilianum]
MPPPLPSQHRGMTANPLKPVGRYRPGKAIAEEESSEEESEEENIEAQKELERKRRAEEQRRRQQAPKASSFPGAAIKKAQEEEDEDEEGFVTDEDEDEAAQPIAKAVPQARIDTAQAPVPKPTPVAKPAGSDEEEDDDDEEEEESSEEESSSEDEAPRRMLIRPTFIKKDKRGNTQGAEAPAQAPISGADSAADSEAKRAQRQEKADQLVRDQLEKNAIARSAANKAWDDDDDLAEADEETAIDDRDGIDPEAEYAAWKLRELKRVKREREAIEEAEKEREEIERRRNLTAEEREREDREFIAKQNEEREATRGQTGFMQRYFHKGAFFRDDQEREGLDQRNVMGRRFADDVAVETLPQYMQIRDMTKLGKKGRTRYRDLKTEDTGRFGEGYQNRRRENAPPIGITDERFMPDRGDDRGQGPSGPTGANASVVRQRRRSRSRSRSPRRDRHDERSRSRERRKRSPSPYDDRDKRRRVESS